jgi:hypothetical protein
VEKTGLPVARFVREEVVKATLRGRGKRNSVWYSSGAPWG